MALTNGYIKGQLIRFGLTGGKVLANEKDAKLSIKPTYETIQNKDDVIGIKVQVDYSYSLTVGQDLKWDTNINRTTFEQILDAALSGSSLPFTYAVHTTAVSPIPNSGDKLLTGSVVVSGLDINAPFKGQAMSDITLEGSGPLVKTTAV
jgi:hypothetical protein